MVPVEGTTAPIPRDSALLEILRTTRDDVRLDSQTLGSIARLLPAADREWLDNAGAHLLFPLVASTGVLLGVVAIGEARTGLPYTATHFALVTAAGGRAALQIENRRLRGREADESCPRRESGAQGLDWQDEPAVYCPACALVWSPETRRCSCGSATTGAALPLIVQGKFRLERLVGAGGMGVVYLAVDMVLDRQVAIKTLPSLRSESAERLHREARTMAKVLHPNLALIYGTEQWRGTPMLIVEYLDGGTLRDWIRRGPVPYADVIDLGIVLADVLDRVHASGVLHRDVKPSNIGYTSDRRPKLLDFGLALLDQARRSGRTAEPLSGRATEVLARSADPAATVSVDERLVGTPLYLAPEALAGIKPQPSFDLWGLALVLYEAIAGRHPFAADDVRTVLAAAERAGVPDIRDYRPKCPAGLARVSARCVVTEHHGATGECGRHAKRTEPAQGEHPDPRSLTATRGVPNRGQGRSPLNARHLAQGGAMAQLPDLDYILSDCFLAVGQAVGSAKTVDFDTVIWWHQRYRRAFHHAITARGTSWAPDRRRVTAVGRYLGQRVVEHAGGRASIDREAAARGLGRGRAGLPDERDPGSPPASRLYEFGHDGVLLLAGIMTRLMRLSLGRQR